MHFGMPNGQLRLLITQPTVGGSKSIIACYDVVMTLARPFVAVVTMTTNPGSRRPYTREKGKDFFTISHRSGSARFADATGQACIVSRLACSDERRLPGQ